MSHVASHWAIRQRGISPSAKLVLMVLADYHNSADGGCFPSVGTLADVCCCDEKTVKRAISELIDHRLIAKLSRHDTNGRQRSNQYTLVLGETGEGDNLTPSSPPNLTPLEPVRNNHSDTTYRVNDPPDPEKEFWDEAVIMAEALGIPPKSRNSLIGKLLKMAGKDYNQVSAAMEDAVAKQVEDPVPWLIAALGGKKKSYSAKQKDKIDDAFAQLRAAGERRAAEWREKYGTEYGILPDTGDGGGEHHGELYTQSLERSYHLSEQRRSRAEEVQSGSLAKTNGSGGWDFD